MATHWGRRIAEGFGRLLSSMQGHIPEPQRLEIFPDDCGCDEDDGTITVAVAYNEEDVRWVFRALIEVVEEGCDLPGCDEPTEAVLIMVDSDEPTIETAIRICTEHLAEILETGSNVYLTKARWN